ncbi:hypothetical protein F5H01DRAFT_58333 [Linnemannia elongata]|nr:hypothetical protein F5H01DRAFT_58333 [Linnemannia elongata]
MAVSVWGWVWGLCTIEIAWCGCGTIRKEEVGKKEKEGKRKEGKKKKEKLDISFESLMRFSGQVYLSLSLSLTPFCGCLFSVCRGVKCPSRKSRPVSSLTPHHQEPAM